MEGYTTKGIFMTQDGEWLSENETKKVINDYLNGLHEPVVQEENHTNHLFVSIVFVVLLVSLFTLGYTYGVDLLLLASAAIILLTSFFSFLYFKSRKKNPKPAKKVEILDISYDENIFMQVETSKDSRLLLSHNNNHGLRKELSCTVHDNDDAIVTDIQLANEILNDLNKPILNTSKKSKIDKTEIYSFDAETELRKSLERIYSDLSDSKEINLSFSFVNDTDFQEFIDEHTVWSNELDLKTEVSTTDLKDLKRLLNSQNKFKNDLIDLTASIAKRFDLSIQNFSTYIDEMESFRNKMILFSIEAAYYIFCPKCNSDFFEQKDFAEYQFNENAKASYDFNREHWVCDSCGSHITHLIPVPKIYQELIQPMVRQLLMEHHTERENLYNDIENQKISYVEKYRKEIREINRINSSETEKIMTSIASLEAEIEADKENLVFYHELIEKQKSELNSSLSSIDSAFQKIRFDTEKATEVSISEMSMEMNEIWMTAEKTFNQLSEIQRETDRKRDEQFNTIVSNTKKQTELAERANQNLQKQTELAEKTEEHSRKVTKDIGYIADVTQKQSKIKRKKKYRIK